MMINMIISAGILLAGYYMRVHSPADIDYTVGFRTVLAMTGEKQWRFANRSCGKLWLIIGASAFLSNAGIVLALLIGAVESSSLLLEILVGIGQIIAAIISAVFVQKQLKAKFGNNTETQNRAMPLWSKTNDNKKI